MRMSGYRRGARRMRRGWRRRRSRMRRMRSLEIRIVSSTRTTASRVNRWCLGNSTRRTLLQIRGTSFSAVSRRRWWRRWACDTGRAARRWRIHFPGGVLGYAGWRVLIVWSLHRAGGSVLRRRRKGVTAALSANRRRGRVTVRRRTGSGAGCKAGRSGIVGRDLLQRRGRRWSVRVGARPGSRGSRKRRRGGRRERGARGYALGPVTRIL